ncbi:MAG: hypothetical protein A2600_06105 [Candidatus Lambdaproteobacteria bacterium RIFOXYD1_FULL_56_27]|uniref:Non-canonical purine NTP pyrophosphatase, RdgB/HAM1 family n=1 Tax=Candidatus Lambdaproteobacteria bacterium RIFOXYD2_FULL_56_26 TaxID=1817773 RepID=A0A1F6GLE9_9PROT|nr:MAG: hypothetical protein A2557_13095 [Candidatus Lambdaproteobacteria bacterium RIFOXYD2_FULL_56_26]OGH05460.1 MAG: hypothetical protein A2426_03675 [Candidatus Lambdaproteobacteria bacterium RIFOXYC1_FULL_56_13]OGH09751.1 MAG: hypothetical protein A2600_06105 [Candidatus Lambdaproteobacteria bacterium RIFOXYD1_FULL_56_27]
MTSVKRLLLITGNPGKAREFASLMPGLTVEHKALELLELQSLSAQEVGRHKALEALSQLPDREKVRYDAVLTDDSSLSFTALNGFPGALVKFCLDALGPEGLAGLLDQKDRSAVAECCLSLSLTQTGEVIQFIGKVPGTIQAPQGREGFGWDGIFYPQGSDLSYAQLSQEQKNSISHRSVAVKQLLRWLGQ